MNIEYVARNFDLDDRIRDFTEGKLRKVEKFLHEPAEVRVSLEMAKHRHIADLHFSHRFGIIQATEATDDMFDAINLAVDKAEKQARRASKKFKDRRRRADRHETQPSWPVEVVERNSVGGGNQPRIIRSSAIQIKPMSIEEAALKLEGSRNDFLVFRDATSDRVTVLYKRKDQNYGLITPEA